MRSFDITLPAPGGSVAVRLARPEAILIGGRIDFMSDGGWLAGCLNLLAGGELLGH